jgi:hypothetical protein
MRILPPTLTTLKNASIELVRTIIVAAFFNGSWTRASWFDALEEEERNMSDRAVGYAKAKQFLWLDG